MSAVRPISRWPRGRVERLPFRSALLADNPWDDPAERELTVYLPPGYDGAAQRYPTIFYLAAYTNSGRAIGNWRAFGENLAERLDRLIATGAIGPVVVVAPDAFTSLGGNQYVDSPAVGPYGSHVHDELVPFVNAHLRVRPERAHRAVVGKSSGGFGALWFAMRRPDVWGAVACQSADCHFDVTIRPDFPKVAALLARHGGDPLAFLRWFWAQSAPSGAAIHGLMFLCLAASYDPTEEGTIRLPFTLDTVELDPERWARWLAHDPIHAIGDHAEALRAMRTIYLDCGNRDEYNLQFGMRILSRELEALAIPHRYEEFDGSHSGIDWRLDRALPAIYEGIAP